MNEGIKTLVVAAVVVIAVVVVIRSIVQGRKNKAIAESGEDKERLRRAVAEALPNEPGLRTVFAHYEETQYSGRTRRTTYYNYALAFDAERVFVFPLSGDKNKIQLGGGMVLHRGKLGVAIAEGLRHRNGDLWRVNVTLRDKNDLQLLEAWVDVENLSDNDFQPLNIRQEAEAEQFLHFMENLSAQVERENPELTATRSKKGRAAEVKQARNLGIGGLICVPFIPLLAIIFGALGVSTAKKAGCTRGLPMAALVLGIMGLVCHIVGFIAITMS